MSKAQTTRKLPDGKYTISTRRYITEWKRLAKQVETALDARVYAFDPDFGISLKDGSGTFSLPLWAAKRIAKLAGDAR